MLPGTCLMESITITYGAITYYFYIFHGIIYDVCTFVTQQNYFSKYLLIRCMFNKIDHLVPSNFFPKAKPNIGKHTFFVAGIWKQLNVRIKSEMLATFYRVIIKTWWN